MIDVPQKEVMNWTIPVPCELIPRNTVPPVRVESTVRKICELGEEIQNALPNDIPSLLSLSVGQQPPKWSELLTIIYSIMNGKIKSLKIQGKTLRRS